ncbi:MAG: protease modulator HflC [Gammaproteobacteria bacterium]|nr:protease modulator HflC [Gammaproteobacteria bacterium]
MKNVFTNLLIVIFVAVLAIANSVFTVDERELALKFRFKRIVGQDFRSGLHFKWPFIENVVKFDDRVLDLSNPDEEFLTSEKKNLKVDFFVKWQIIDAPKFYRAMNQAGATLLKQQAFEMTGRRVLLPIVKDALSVEFRNRTVNEVVSTARDELMADVLTKSRTQAGEKGVKIIDVRVKQVELPNEVSERVYNRMRQERNRVVKQLEAEGEEEAKRIRAEAERERTIELANAYREAEKIRGAGDAQAAATYAKAYNRNAEFYSFYRSMQAYRESIGLESDVLVLAPDNEFFKYLNEPRPQ